MSETESQEAPSATELLDQLVDCYPSKEAMIRALGVPRSSVHHWFTGKRDPHPEGLTKIHRLAVHHGLIAPDTPIAEPAERDWQPAPEPMTRKEKIIFGTIAAGIAGLFAWLLIPVRSA